MWIIDQRHLEQTDYELVACVEGRQYLYVIGDGPSPKDIPPDDRMTWTIKVDSVELLALRGFGSSGDKQANLVIAKAELPPPHAKSLEITMDMGGVPKIHVSLSRRPGE